VAGNVVASSQIGSVEFAVQEFGTPLVVVLGHTQCGAVHATIQELGREESQRSPNLASIVDRITPAVQPLLAEGLDEPALVARSTRANIRQSVERLKTGSEILEGHLKEDGVMIIGAEYDLHTGVVDFFGE
jgi:carbonic anhydrase